MLTHSSPKGSDRRIGRFFVNLARIFAKCDLFRSYLVSALYYGDDLNIRRVYIRDRSGENVRHYGRRMNVKRIALRKRQHNLSILTDIQLRMR